MKQPEGIEIKWWDTGSNGYVALNWLEEEIHIGYGYNKKIAYMKAADLLRDLANECAAKSQGED